MSSVFSSPAQVDRRTGYFYVVANLDGNNCVSVDSGYTLTATMTSAEFDTATTANTDVDSGMILRDMGKQVTIVNATTGLHTQVWRRVQVVNGATSEGVLASVVATPVDIYVLTWAAAGTNVSVVRTG
jgi:hypothetical protein